MSDFNMAETSSSAARPTSSNRPFSLIGALHNVRNSFHAQFPSTSPTTSAPSAEHASARQLETPTLPSASTSSSSDAWPPLISERKLARLFPEHDTRNAVRQFYKEKQLDWDCDPQSLGERSESNRAAAALFELLVRLDVQGASESDQPEHSARSLGDADDVVASGSKTDSALQQGGSKASTRPKEWEAHDVLQAIDKKDIETIMRIRDASFDLLLDGASASTSKSAPTSSTPLGYAISLGPAWEGVAIVLVGAMSRFVNQLPDEQAQHHRADIRAGKHAVRKSSNQLDVATQARLRKLRTNLKLAIDHSISLSQVPLVTSYVQVLFMSEGSSFLHDATLAVQRAVLPHTHDSALSPPALTVARGAVERFVAPHLRSRAGTVSSKSVSTSSVAALPTATTSIAALEDLMANASLDIVLLALWDLILLRPSEYDILSIAHHDKSQSSSSDTLLLSADDTQDLCEALPLYFFARDDRMTWAYLQRVKNLEKALANLEVGNKVSSKRERRALRIARSVALALQEGGRRLSAKEREDKVAKVLQGEGC